MLEPWLQICTNGEPELPIAATMREMELDLEIVETSTVIEALRHLPYGAFGFMSSPERSLILDHGLLIDMLLDDPDLFLEQLDEAFPDQTITLCFHDLQEQIFGLILLQDGIERRRIICTWAEGALEGQFDGKALPFEAKMIAAALNEDDDSPKPTTIKAALEALKEQPEQLEKLIIYAHNYFARQTCDVDWSEDDALTVFAEAS